MGVSRVRLMQVMAGGSRGGAEAFFERLAVALEAPDLQQQLAIRRDPGRTARLRAAGLQVSEHAFGGRLDLATPWQLRRLARRFRRWPRARRGYRAALPRCDQPGVARSS